MIINITDLKKKIIYRSTYRGTKEMDCLLTSFTKKYVNNLNDKELILLYKLLDIDDDNLYKFNLNKPIPIQIEANKVTELFKNFKLKD